MPETVLAFDFGTHHIGVAVGVSVTGRARGVATLNADNGKPKWHELKQLLEDYAPNACVVGLPLNMDGTESQMSNLSRQFAKQLQNKSGLEVQMYDERLTSREAKAEFAQFRDQGLASSEHELAAIYIAQDYLASHQS